MSLRHKKSVSPLRHHQFPAPDDGGRRWSSSSRDAGRPPRQREAAPPGYCVEWNAQTRRRRVLVDGRDLRAEVVLADGQQQQQQHRRPEGMRRLLVVHGLDGHVAEILGGAGGVDAAFLEAHARRRGYRPRETATAAGDDARWWSWEYPETGGGGGDDVSLRRVSLWSSSRLTLLLVNRPEAPPPLLGGGAARARRGTPPRLRHQDAATRASRLKTASHYVAADEQPEPPPSMDSDMYSSLGGPHPLEQVLGELVYHRWLDLFDTLGCGGSCRRGRSGRQGVSSILWAALASLEQNQDSSRYLDKRGRPLGTPSHADWTDLIARVHWRLSSRTMSQYFLTPPSSSSSSSSSGADGRADADQRSLDRISYLGGLLLPVTVVSGILAIEGDYGPEGGNFWVFWVASVGVSAVTVMFIYLDQMRSLHVWVEVAADALAEEEKADGGEQEMDDGGAGQGGRRVGGLVVQRMTDGELVRAWRRTELGWRGAAKKASGYYRWRGGPRGMQFEAPRVDGTLR
ncbi:hypothetical protein ACO1O0_007465 [Amphichorda felina]